ncbi:inner membrane protein YiaA [Piscinibacter sakaiensis]|uniref:YiaAB two helix domain-containing protein n=1 Tax=Piscinibacter sakaiensis TaxID=1547922 RepID=A0A0K8P0G2_PISS1|nr:inner membrane protein YiaA [Piscinibacter sakaiensis]GAP36118.1 hypothetical protein ISF6_1958 [Piscinibacter sakaiensis]
MRPARRPATSAAFVGASWLCLFIGVLAFLAGLWNAEKMLQSEKGFYLAVMLLGLYAAVSLQKVVRDRLEGIPVSGLYYGLSWVALGAALALLATGLWNASLAPSEKGFYGMAFVLSLFAAVAVQKNVRDKAAEAAEAGGGPDTRPPGD